MIKTGLVIGKFAPLTRGHINLINTAATMCERVIVVVSHDNRWLNKQNERDQKVLQLKNRVRWLEQTYADIDHVIIKHVVEDDVPEYPNGWEGYCDLIDKSMREWGFYTEEDILNKNYTIFSSELGYEEGYKKYLPHMNHLVVDAERTRVPISATMIREDLMKYWEFLPSVVRKDYVRKVVIIGTESSGKTTLTKYLAKLYNTSWVEEYGRTYCEVDLVGNEELLTSEDYNKIAFRHKELEFEAERTANKIMFVDTNAFITEFYHRLYEHRENPVVTAIAKEEHYDLVIVLAPTVKWVDDGLRINSDRSITSELFEQMKKEFPNQFPEGRTVYIDSTDYKVRMDEAVNAVDGLINHFNIGEF